MSDEDKSAETGSVATSAPDASVAAEKTVEEKIFAEENQVKRPQIDGAEVADEAADEATDGTGDKPEGDADTAGDEADKADDTDKEADKGEDKGDEKPGEIELKNFEESVLTDAKVEEIAEFAKKQGFSQEQADQVLKLVNDQKVGLQTESQETFEDLTKTWRKDIEKDKEFGGDKLGENAEFAHRFLRRFFDQDFITELDAGWGNHPGLFRGLARAGRVMGADSFVTQGSEAKPKPKSIQERIFPSSPKQ